MTKSSRPFTGNPLLFYVHGAERKMAAKAALPRSGACLGKDVNVGSLFRSFLLISLRRGTECGLGVAPRDISPSAFRTDVRVVGHRLRDDFLVFSLGLSPRVGHMLRFVGADSVGCPFRAELCGCLKRDRRVIGPILVLSVFAGLALIGVKIRLSGSCRGLLIRKPVGLWLSWSRSGRRDWLERGPDRRQIGHAVNEHRVIDCDRPLLAIFYHTCS